MIRDTCIVIPAFNEGKVIRRNIEQISKKFPFVVCINDGSSDNSSEEIFKTDAVLVEHCMNLGQGAALQTGIEYALQFPEVQYFVTFDADGQHDINDVVKMTEHLKKRKLDIVLGSRFLGTAHNITGSKKFLLKQAVRFTNSFSGVKLTDTHNGLRVFNRDFAEKLELQMAGMSHASEIIEKIGLGNWRYEEVPVNIHYTDYSQAKGQSMLNSVNIIFDLLLNRFSKR